MVRCLRECFRAPVCLVCSPRLSTPLAWLLLVFQRGNICVLRRTYEGRHVTHSSCLRKCVGPSAKQTVVKIYLFILKKQKWKHCPRSLAADGAQVTKMPGFFFKENWAGLHRKKNTVTPSSGSRFGSRSAELKMCFCTGMDRGTVWRVFNGPAVTSRSISLPHPDEWDVHGAVTYYYSSISPLISQQFEPWSFSEGGLHKISLQMGSSPVLPRLRGEEAGEPDYRGVSQLF